MCLVALCLLQTPLQPEPENGGARMGDRSVSVKTRGVLTGRTDWQGTGRMKARMKCIHSVGRKNSRPAGPVGVCRDLLGVGDGVRRPTCSFALW